MYLNTRFVIQIYCSVLRHTYSANRTRCKTCRIRSSVCTELMPLNCCGSAKMVIRNQVVGLLIAISRARGRLSASTHTGCFLPGTTSTSIVAAFYSACCSSQAAFYSACCTSQAANYTACCSGQAANYTACCSSQAANYTACCSSQAASYTACCSSQAANYTACWSSQAANYTACCSSQAANYTACCSSQAANYTACCSSQAAKQETLEVFEL